MLYLRAPSPLSAFLNVVKHLPAHHSVCVCVLFFFFFKIFRALLRTGCGLISFCVLVETNTLPGRLMGYLIRISQIKDGTTERRVKFFATDSAQLLTNILFSLQTETKMAVFAVCSITC